MTRSSPDRRWPSLLLGNLLVFAVLAYAWILQSRYPEFYYRSLQEDEYLEWATFWAFVLAAGVFVLAAARQRRGGSRVPWFLLGVGAFCLVVALEEISWGQRLLGYRPPELFLERNYQQELNVHNLLDTSLRKLGLKATLLGYGVVLPVLALFAPLRRLFGRVAIVAPPAGLIPAFVAAYLAYETYPWRFTGEVVELMMGLGFLFAALEARRGLAPGRRRAADWGSAAVVGGAFALVVVLGVATAPAARRAGGVDPQKVAAARAETESLKLDFLSFARRKGSTSVTRCGLHKRLYTYVVQYRADFLEQGRFAARVARGLPEERAEFFLDPWNSPYWIRDRCSDRGRKRAVFVYSFGPDRRRDSTPWEIRGDDIGAEILRRP